MTVHVFFLFPETAGKPLEEVTEMFECYETKTNKNESEIQKGRGGEGRRGGGGIKYVGIPAWRTKSEFGRQMRRERGEVEVEVEVEEELGGGEKGELERREVVRYGGKEGEV